MAGMVNGAIGHTPLHIASEFANFPIVKYLTDGLMEQSQDVSFSSCQRNLIKTFQIEGMIALIIKMDLIFS